MMGKPGKMGIYLGLMLALSIRLVGVEVRREGRIVDDATGKPLAARVAVTNPDGRFLEIEGKHEHVLYLNKRWCYVDGSFAVSIPASGAVIEIRRGLETRPLTVTVSGEAAGKDLQKTFRLRRWTDMRQKGFLNGDIHAHLPAPKEAHLEMLAEDLNALNLLALEGSDYPGNDCFTGRLDQNSTSDCELYVGQEVIDWQMGHLTLLGLSKMVPGFPQMGGNFMTWSTAPNWDILRAARAVRAQKGVICWSHFSSLPGKASPIGVALGLIDALELMTYNDPTQLPNHWDPWKQSGMSQAEFPIMRGMDLYYQYLNAGFRLPIAAGSDKYAEDIPLGSNRIYVPTKGVAGYDAWLAGVKAGTGFITNGPMLEFEVEGRTSGDAIEFHGTKRVKARVKASSILPFNTLDIVMNGEVIATKTPVPQSHPAKDGVYSMELETTVELDRSAWLAARVADYPDIRNFILPRNLSVFAHTNPIYFLRDGRKVREEASISYLRKYVEGVIHWLGTKPAFANEADRLSSEQGAAEALRIYKGL
jgi:hypothetical protein